MPVCMRIRRTILLHKRPFGVQEAEGKCLGDKMIIAELAFEFNRIFSRQKWEGVLRIFKAMTAAAVAAAAAAAAAVAH